MRRNFHFVAATPAGEITEAAAKKFTNILGPAMTNTTSTTDADDTDTVASFKASTPTATSSAYNIAAHFLAERDRYIEDIRRWEQAAEPLFAGPSCQPPQKGKAASKGSLQSSLMKLHSSFNRVLISRTCLPPDTSSDAHVPEFQKQVEFCELVAPYIGSSNKSLTVYRFDLGIICLLSQISAVCRHSPTRERALGVMEAYRGRKEGVYDCAGSTVIGKFFRDVEEEDGGVDEEGWVRDDRKVWMKGIECSVYKKKATVTLVRECDGFETVGHLKW